MRTFGNFRPGGHLEGASFYGELLPDGQTVRALQHPFWIDPDTAAASGTDHPLSALEVGVPLAPSKLLAVGRNYAAHARERGHEAPTTPMTWLKGPSSLLAHGGVIELPHPEHKVDFETELCVVIGRTAKSVPAAEADRYIFGYTLGLDMSDRVIQDSEKQFYRAKSFDTFTPLGPFVYSDVDSSDLPVTLHQNGEERQNGRTSEMIFKPRDIVAFLSQSTTLLPGDVIMTGTPAGVGPVKEGDRLEARIGPFAPLVVSVRNAAR